MPSSETQIWPPIEKRAFDKSRGKIDNFSTFASEKYRVKEKSEKSNLKNWKFDEFLTHFVIKF